MNSIPRAKIIIFWLMIFCLIFIAMTARRPDVIFNAQPWAEDGRIWLKGVYESGLWNSLFKPQDGYFQTIPRLTYGIALAFGLGKAALVSNVISISIRVFFLLFILSKRFSFIDMKFRVIAAIYFIMMPNVAEGFVNITNVHWYLSMYLLAVIIASPAPTTISKIHDTSVMVLSGLSGPFVIFLAPCLIIKRLHERGGFLNALKGINIFDVTMATCCVIQILSILTAGGGPRSPAPLGASFDLFTHIITAKLFFGTFFDNTFSANFAKIYAVRISVFILLSLGILYSIATSGWRIRSIAVFPIIMLSFALAKPMVSFIEAQWPPIINPGVGERYFFITNFCFFLYCLFIISKIRKNQNLVLLAFCCVLIPFLISSFRIPALAEVGYKSDILKFNNAHTGESVNIRINPPGWSMDLIKK
jgi:hypothetical protein